MRWPVLSGFGTLSLLGVLGCESLTVRLGGPELPAAAPLVVEGVQDLGRDNAAGRICTDGGDSVAYSVVAIDGAALETAEEVSAGCIESGDEVLLIVMQAPALDVSHVGEHELLRVDYVSGRRVSLVTDLSADWEALGAAAAEYRIVLQRVPSYERLAVSKSGKLTAPAWNGETGGVFLIRVLGDAVIDGQIAMSDSGYRGGAQRDEVLAHGLQGESVAGQGEGSTLPNLGGGGGGLGDQTTEGCVQDGNAGGGGGYVNDGQDAQISDLCEATGRGHGGRAYASPGKLFLGSGGGSGGVDNVRVDNPPGGAGGTGGGIVWLFAQSITGNGAIRAEGGSGRGDEEGVECERSNETTRCFDHSGAGGGGAGGSIRLDAPRVELTDVSVAGGVGGNGLDSAGGNGGNGSVGVIEQ